MLGVPRLMFLGLGLYFVGSMLVLVRKLVSVGVQLFVVTVVFLEVTNYINNSHTGKKH